MYKKEEVFNLRNKNYELTEMDERIYNETGYVLHQIVGAFVYKQGFGTIYNKILVSISRSGNITASRWFLTSDGDADFEMLPVPTNILELAKLKYEELKNGYWKE
jgi:hypothetical protein